MTGRYFLEYIASLLFILSYGDIKWYTHVEEVGDEVFVRSGGDYCIPDDISCTLFVSSPKSQGNPIYSIYNIPSCVTI